MKTTRIIPLALAFWGILSFVHSQDLKNSIKKSVLELKGVSKQIPQEKVLLLDKLAAKISEHAHKSDFNLVFIDHANDDISQSAMIWLRTGLIHYGIADKIRVESAGIKTNNKNLSGLSRLRKYGFNVSQTGDKKLFNYNVRYGSDSWKVYRKELESLTLDIGKTLQVFVQEGLLESDGENKMEILFQNRAVIPGQMVYVAGKISNLLKT